MKSLHYVFTVSTAVIATYSAYVDCAMAASPAVLSQYGQIQSVKNYSSNPFWNADSPYNARMPTPIYATGADLTTGDCNRTVETLIASYCTSNNNCKNLRLSDVRPKIMVQLSQLPGHNFATSCGGYIDSAFDNYQKKYGNTSTNSIIKQTPTTNNTTKTPSNTIQLKNPYAPTPTEYQIGVAERAAELRALQSETATPTDLSPTEFPKTVADLSLSDKMALATAGYEPYQGKSAYRTIEIESDEDFRTRQHRIICAQDPNNSICQSPTTTQSPSGNGGSGGGGNGGSGQNPNPSTASSGAQCLINIANDATFQSKMSSNLSGVTDLQKWIANNKTSFYSFMAEYVIKYCLGGSAFEITEFNTLLDSSSTINISVTFNGSPTSVPLDKMELFDYATYWSYPIVINNSGAKDIGTILQKSEASLPRYSRKCTSSFYTSEFTGPSGSLPKTAIEVAARPVYPTTKGAGFILGSISFPGMLYNYHQSLFGGKPTLVKTQNYAQAREQIKQFASGIISDGGCNGNNMLVYLVSEVSPDDDNATQVKIMSEPFVIR